MPKRLKLFFLIFILFNISGRDLSPANLSQSNLALPFTGDKVDLLSEPGSLKNNIAIGACLLALIFLGVYQAQLDRMPEALKFQFKPQNLALNFASTYCMNFACTFFHELGHGIAKKILTGADFKIHLGKNSDGNNSDERAQPLIDSKYFSIDGLDPMAGFNMLKSGESEELKEYTSLQKILINLAGGASAILGYYLLRTAIFCVQNFCVSNFCVRDNISVLQNFKNALSQAITVDPIVIHHLFDMLVPMQSAGKLHGDAATVWQELGIKNSVIKSVADIQTCLQMLAFIALSFKQSDSDTTNQRYVADKILIGLANYFLQGFAQFKSV